MMRGNGFRFWYFVIDLLKLCRKDIFSCYSLQVGKLCFFFVSRYTYVVLIDERKNIYAIHRFFFMGKRAYDKVADNY